MVKVSNYWILLLGMILSFLSFYFINRQEQLKRINILTNNSVSVKNKINTELSKVNLMIESLSFFVQNTPEINQPLFTKYTTPFLKESNGIKALEWAPLVSELDRLNYEEKQCLNIDNEFFITQKGDGNSLIRAKNKIHYYPVHFINPLVTNKKALGYDLSSNFKRNQSIESSLKSGKMSFTEPINLVQENNESYGFLVIKHLIESKYNSSGVVLGVYSMTVFMNNLLDYEFKNLDIVVYDKSDKNTNLFTSIKKNDQYSSEKVFFEFEVIAADRKWIVNCFDKNNLLSYPHTLGGYLVLFLGLLLTFSLFIMMKRKENYNIILEKKIFDRTNRLIKINNQKDTLLKEIHHRVKNNMQAIKSLIGLQARYINDEKVKELFQNTKNRINSMAMVHEMLYHTEDVSKINGKAYILNLINELIYSYKTYNDDVKLIESMDDIKLNIDTSIPLGLIITEIITNTLKYGGNHNSIIINVELKVSEDSQYEMIISDNGPGFELPKKEDISSLGLRLIFRLISQLNGEIIKVDNVSGVMYKIIFKEINS
ncbi:MAG: CHASE domain-containing protein [Flavobacteriaceae bacterium]|nr:CHASE domain-containing protein [Flavobacteriaceae bacterium]